MIEKRGEIINGFEKIKNEGVLEIDLLKANDISFISVKMNFIILHIDLFEQEIKRMRWRKVNWTLFYKMFWQN